jgi:hypothetical protein
MVTTGFLVAGLFFARFWARSRDSLFLAFAAAFWLLALNQLLVSLVDDEAEDRQSWLYLLRVVAFLLIAIAIVRKNADGAGNRTRQSEERPVISLD